MEKNKKRQTKKNRLPKSESFVFSDYFSFVKIDREGEMEGGLEGNTERNDVFIMRQGRGNEATEAVFCLKAKKPLHSGSYDHRCQK